MPISDKAHKNHSELFDGVGFAPSDATPPLTETDPEFLDIFLNFAFEEVYDHDETYDKQLRMLVILASMIAQNTRPRYKVFLAAALNIGVKPAQVMEVVYQAIPYCGIARVFDIIYDTNEVFAAQGIALPVETKATVTRASRFEKGLAAQKAIFGDGIDTMRANAPADEKHIQDYLSANCFGDYYTRDGLGLKTRELLTFVILISMGDCEPQVKAHVQGNLNIGNDTALLKETVTQLIPYIGYPRSLNAIAVINEVTKGEK